MSFGLKNARATYQRLVNKIFKDETGKLVKVYIDNILVNSLDAKTQIKDLGRAF